MRHAATPIWLGLTLILGLALSGALAYALGLPLEPSDAGGGENSLPAFSDASPGALAIPRLTPAALTPTPAGTPDHQTTDVSSLDPPTPTVQTTPIGGGRIVALDPGHGGMDAGAPTAIEIGGRIVPEKAFTLEIARLAAEFLEADGFTVVLAREEDQAVNNQGADLNGDGEISNADELQARVDIANAADADLLISIHLNAFEDPAVNGTETYYCDARPFSDKNKALASLLQKATLDAVARKGYTPSNRGIKLDMTPDDPRHMVLHGPASERTLRPSLMPSGTMEVLYMSNPQEADLLKTEGTLKDIAQGIDSAANIYFEIYP